MTRAEFIDSVFLRTGTDKSSESHCYASVYATIPENISTILEIGVSLGRSLRAWLDIFPQAEIYGIDQAPLENEELLANPRIHFICANIREFHPVGLPMFDLIVDDASHDTDDIIKGWQTLRLNLKGRYLVEDVTITAIAPIRGCLGDIVAEVIVTNPGDGDSRIMLWGNSTREP